MFVIHLKRCDWASNEFLIKYHDREWGVPLHNDRKLFEFLILDGMQAGLSWYIILKNRISFRKAFENFDPKKISEYKESKISKLLQTDGIIKNRQKIESAVNNAKRFLEVKKEFDSFDEYIWSFVNGKTKINKFKKWTEIPAFTKESEIMSKDMKQRGFTFVGPTICYAFMQSAGLVNDHIIDCFRRKSL